MTILSCPGCDHRLRVPDNKRGTVTCPLCGSEWFHPETIELSSVEFRCSASGAKFNVISSRRSPLHKFTVQKVEKAVPKATGPLEAGSPRSPPQPKPRNASPALPPAAPGVVGWLARMVGRKTDVIQVRKDGRFHQCFCGHAAFIIGNIKTFENERLSVKAKADPPNVPPSVRERQGSKPADPALPAPAQGVPAKR